MKALAQACHDSLSLQGTYDCAKMIPEPFDAPPVRSPQAVHTLLTQRFRGANVVQWHTVR